MLLVTHEQSVGERAENILRLKDGLIESVHRGQRGKSGATQAFEASRTLENDEAEVVTFAPGESSGEPTSNSASRGEA